MCDVYDYGDNLLLDGKVWTLSRSTILRFIQLFTFLDVSSSFCRARSSERNSFETSTEAFHKWLIITGMSKLWVYNYINLILTAYIIIIM